MDRKILYAFRGWIAFVAFMDLGTAVRSYIEKRSFLSKTLDTDYVDGKVVSYVTYFLSLYFLYNSEEYTTSRIIGIYSILKALALIHCTLYIHYKP